MHEFADEPPFTEAELERAAEFRQAVTPDWHQKRRDQCPHAVQCKSWEECVEQIAWYFRHRHELEDAIAASNLTPGCDCDQSNNPDRLCHAQDCNWRARARP